MEKETFDIILMDVQMPEMDGYQATARILEWEKTNRLPHTPIIALTANAMKGDEERIREGGCEAYISKPISVMMFLDTVKQFIGEAR